MIGELVGSYRIVRQLGAGGMGVVYEAEDTRLGRHVALKFLPESLDVSPDAAARFEREARVASSINHPNICTIYDIGVASTGGRDRRFIVMELLEGESLRGRLASGALPMDDVIDIASAAPWVTSSPGCASSGPGRAMPKSNSFAWPRRVMKMLAGFTSRWTMPFACAASSASAIARPCSSTISTPPSDER
jgi:hypothetical protein